MVQACSSCILEMVGNGWKVECTAYMGYLRVSGFPAGPCFVFPRSCHGSAKPWPPSFVVRRELTRTQWRLHSWQLSHA